MSFKRLVSRLPRSNDPELILLYQNLLHHPAILSVLGELRRLFAASFQMCVTALPVFALGLYFLWLCSESCN